MEVEMHMLKGANQPHFDSIYYQSYNCYMKVSMKTKITMLITQ